MALKLTFSYPTDLFGQFEILLATKAYEMIWQEDGDRIIERFKHYTGLEFAQDEIEVKAHDGMSMSGMAGKPMRLSIWNKSLTERRNALTHELAHRLLFGHGLYAEPETNTDNDEIRALLFQGDVLQDLYGQAAYDYWANKSPNKLTDEHLKDLNYVLTLTKDERIGMIREITGKANEQS